MTVFFCDITTGKFHSQIREQMSGPDLHVFTLKFLALKKWVFHVFGVKKKLYKKGIAQLFSADAIVFFGSIFFFFFNFFEVAHNRPRPFYSTIQPNWIFILWNVGTRHLFSYLWFHSRNQIQSYQYCWVNSIPGVEIASCDVTKKSSLDLHSWQHIEIFILFF